MQQHTVPVFGGKNQRSPIQLSWGTVKRPLQRDRGQGSGSLIDELPVALTFKAKFALNLSSYAIVKETATRVSRKAELERPEKDTALQRLLKIALRTDRVTGHGLRQLRCFPEGSTGCRTRSQIRSGPQPAAC